MKIVALDIGDVWTGIAISDALEIIARPLTTVPSATLEAYLTTLIKQENLKTIVIGNPITLRGTISQQTEKVHLVAQHLRTIFPDVEWVLRDERLSSKQAAAVPGRSARTPEEKKISHARAAAFILSSYLEYRRNQQSNMQKEA